MARIKDLLRAIAPAVSCAIDSVSFSLASLAPSILSFVEMITILGAPHFGMTIVGIAFGWFWRLGVILLCLIAVTMIYESLR